MRSHRRHLRPIVWILSMLYATWLAWAPQAAGASCAEMPLTASQANADIIVLGQVAQTTGQDARFVVDTYTKGRGPRELNITGRVSPDPGWHTSVDFIFQQGTRYLLFLKGSPPGLLRTDECAGNREGATALTAEERAVLGQGVPPDQASADPPPLSTQLVASGPSLSVGPAVNAPQTTIGTPDNVLPPDSTQPRPTPVVTGKGPSTTRAPTFLLPVGILLVGLLLLIVMRRRRRAS